MATDASFVDYVIEQAGLGEGLSARKMFGEYAIYHASKVVALACDNSLFIKPTEAVAKLAPGLPLRPPYPGAKPFPVADELLDDGEALQALLLATSAALPLPKPKKPKKKAASARAKSRSLNT